MSGWRLLRNAWKTGRIRRGRTEIRCQLPTGLHMGKEIQRAGEAGLEDRRGQRIAQQSPRTAEEESKARIAQLEHENYMLKMERDLLKK